MELVRKHDLTFVMAPFLDVHMISPLLDFLRENKAYDLVQITKEKIKCVSKTHMITVVEDEYENLAADDEMKVAFESQKEQLEKSKDDIFALLDNPPQEVLLVSEFFKNDQLIAELKSSDKLNLETLTLKHGISSDALEVYYKNAKFQYECGMYQDAEVMLTNYLSVAQPSNPLVVGALWGRLACHIVQGFWEPSKDDLKALKDAIEIRNIAPMEQLRQRGWILHWSLFVHFTQRDAYDSFLEFASDRVYTQTMQNICPWLLRYYVVAALLSSKRKAMLRDLLNEISNVSNMYTDPILQFVETLYEQFDIDLTQVRLKECLVIMKNDFFLCVHVSKFADLARMLMCEMYCTLYAKVDLAELADKLEVSEDEAEKWMVSMVRNTGGAGGASSATGGKEENAPGSAIGGASSILSNVVLDARIDSAAKQVIIAPPTHNIYQQVVDKTRDVTARCTMLNTNMNTLLQEQEVLIKHRAAGNV